MFSIHTAPAVKHLIVMPALVYTDVLLPHCVVVVDGMQAFQDQRCDV